MKKKINKRHKISDNEPMILIDQSTENVSHTDTKKYYTIKDRLYRLRQVRKDIDEIIDELECERIQELINDLI